MITVEFCEPEGYAQLWWAMFPSSVAGLKAATGFAHSSIPRELLNMIPLVPYQGMILDINDPESGRSRKIDRPCVGRFNIATRMRCHLIIFF